MVFYYCPPPFVFHAHIDVVMETLAGLEMYGLLKASNSAEVRRRVLLCKWLYTLGFFHDEFPHREKFIPTHIAEAMNRGEEDEEEEGDGVL